MPVAPEPPPVPDPTIITTEAIDRATKVFEQRLAALDERVSLRFDDIDKATALSAAMLHEARVHIREFAAAEVAHLREQTEQHQKSTWVLQAERKEHAKEMLTAELRAMSSIADRTEAKTGEELKSLRGRIDDLLIRFERQTGSSEGSTVGQEKAAEAIALERAKTERVTRTLLTVGGIVVTIGLFIAGVVLGTQ